VEYKVPSRTRDPLGFPMFSVNCSTLIHNLFSVVPKGLSNFFHLIVPPLKTVGYYRSSLTEL
ncbi:MAG: hypothetical protein JWM11_826, partial [Planctomycetaceae bacterium]|nr:hypothetical protein [Planctomycetaceae bacterium]